ncbi:MAG TPA: T9SS type A sorting domain-containing protein [Bacteroidales bacterium]|nr:T9SS type A sorting domain-containing protein [Bacteroidales bacterium]
MKPFIIVILSFFLTHAGLAQWIQTNGPYGETEITAITMQDSLTVGSSTCGYFTKSKISEDWKLRSLWSFTCFTVKGDSLYAGSATSGLKLIDLAHPENPPADINTDIAVKALAHEGTYLYAGNQTGGFMKSTDGGLSWTTYNEGLPVDTMYNPWVGYFYLHHVSAIDMTGGYIFCGTKNGIYRNSGNLNLWTEANNGIAPAMVNVLKTYNDTLFAAIHTKLYKSADCGNHWELIHTTASGITAVLKSGQSIFAGTEDHGVYYSPDNGQQWQQLNTGLADLKITALAVTDSSVMCGTKSGGVWFLQGGEWHPDRDGMICSSVRSMTVTQDYLFANDESHVFRLSGEDIWNDFSPNISFDFFSSLSHMNDTIVLSVENNTPPDAPFIMYSPDSGSSWQHINSPPFAGDDPYRIYCSNHRIYAHENEIMYYTGNLGNTWTEISLPSQYCNQFNDFIVFHDTPYAAACGNGQLLKLDNNQQWVISNNGLPADREPIALAASDSALYTYINVHGMYVSHDNGSNWSYANYGLNTDYSINDYACLGELFFVTTNKGVFVTDDYGQNWSGCNDGLKNTNAGAIKIFHDTLYVSTLSNDYAGPGNGIWKCAISDVHTSLPGYLELSSSYFFFPNPAKDKIHPANSVEEADYMIFDMTGKQVRTGHIREKEAIDISKINNGMYLIRLLIKDTFHIAKLVINKD